MDLRSEGSAIRGQGCRRKPKLHPGSVSNGKITGRITGIEARVSAAGSRVRRPAVGIGGSVRGQRARVPASCADGRGAGPAQRLFCRVRASQRVEEFRRTRRVFGMAAPALSGDGSTYAHFSRGRRASRLVTFSLAGARSCLLQLSWRTQCAWPGTC